MPFDFRLLPIKVLKSGFASRNETVEEAKTLAAMAGADFSRSVGDFSNRSLNIQNGGHFDIKFDKVSLCSRY